MDEFKQIATYDCTYHQCMLCNSILINSRDRLTYSKLNGDAYTYPIRCLHKELKLLDKELLKLLYEK